MNTKSGRDINIVVWLALILLAIALNSRFQNGVSAQNGIDYYGKSIRVFGLFGQRRISDTGRNRVTGSGIYHAPGVTVDRSSTPNRIYVVDSGNNRILGFNSTEPMTETRSADIVLGQPDMESASCNRDNNLGFNNSPTAATLCLLGYPLANNTAESWMRVNIDVDSEGNLHVPDFWNNRVLRFNQPFSTDTSNGKGDAIADFVWGQDDMSSNGRNRDSHYDYPSNPDDHSLWISYGNPFFDHVSSRGVSVDADGNVWVADTFNSRVLRFPPDSKYADLVIGQPDFTTNGGWCTPNDDSRPLVKLCTPTLAKLHPVTGELYVLDEYPAPFRARLLVFRPPFTNGMSAYDVVIPNQDGPFTNWDGWDGTGAYMFQSTGFIFNSYREGEYADGEIWLNEHSSNRALLIDFDGNIIEVIGGQDIYTRGGDVAYPNPPCGSIYEGNHLWHPGGSIGMDDANNIFLADEFFHAIYRYALPYNLNSVAGVDCLPDANGVLFSKWPNTQSSDRLGESVGLAVHGDQLIIRDEGMRMKVYDDYQNKPFGVDADHVITGGLPARNRLSASIDDANRLWLAGEHQKISIFQLPITSSTDTPIAKFVELYWSDTGALIDTQVGAMAFDHINKAMYIADWRGTRIFRVTNYSDFDNRLYVDAVIGQRTKDGILCNQGLAAPNAETLCKVSQIKFDNSGNLFVVDNDYECQGNDRIVMFTATDLQNASGLFPNLQASKVFVASSLDERGPCAYGTVDMPGSPVAIAFNSRNTMIVGNDGYYGDLSQRQLRQLWAYSDPLAKQTPDAFIEIYMGTPGELAFDASDNLLIQDHTWYKVMMINFDVDPEWVVYLPGGIPIPGRCRLFLPAVFRSYSPSRSLLELNFEGSFMGTDGEVGIADGVTFSAGYEGQGVLVDESDYLYYSTVGNMSRAMGSIEFWLKPLWDGDDGESYVFFEVGDTWFNRMRIMKDGANNFRFMVWSPDTEYDAAYNVSSWSDDEWHHVRVDWQDGLIALYLDGTLRDTETNIELPNYLASSMYIGSTSVLELQAYAVIDEFVVDSQP